MKIIYLNSDNVALPPALQQVKNAVIEPVSIYDLKAFTPQEWSEISVILIPANANQRFLLTQKAQLEAWLEAGGTFVINGHIAYPFLSLLKTFEPQDVQGIASLQIHPAASHPIFNGVNSCDLTYRRGVAGFYARGSNPPPVGATILNTLGDNQLPVDWLLHLPNKARVLMHSGNDLWMYGAGNDTASLLIPQLFQWLSPKGVE